MILIFAPGRLTGIGPFEVGCLGSKGSSCVAGRFGAEGVDISSCIPLFIR